MSAEVLLTLSRRLHAATDLAEVMDHVVVAVRAATRYRRTWLNVRTADGAALEVVGYAHSDAELMRAQVPALAVDQDPFLRLLFEAESPVIIDDMRADPRPDPKQVEIFGNRTVIAVPMVQLADRVGAFVTGTYADEGVRPPIDGEVEFLTQVGSLITVVAGRLRAEAQARALQTQVLESRRLEALGRLAGEISHDFNNVLVSIVGNAELASVELDDHPALELVTEIQAAAARATRLTRQLLAFSRGQLLDRREVALDEVARGLQPMLQRLLPAGIRFEIDASAATPTVEADAGQLEQVVMNLVLNARDALGASGGRIRVRVEPTPEAEGGEARLTVEDDGPGIPPEVLQNLFDPFFTTKEADQGTGLGLAVVDSIVRQHHGRITVDSTPGRGARFEVRLPPAGPNPTPAVTVGDAPPPRGHSERVLVVDDDPSIRAVLQRTLESAGYRVSVAADGADALAAIEREAPDLVLTDLVMPRMTGGDLVAALRDRATPPKVVVMTGYLPSGAEHDRVRDATKLTKPFTNSDLLQVLRTALDT